jgi:ribonuclease HI
MFVIYQHMHNPYEVTLIWVPGHCGILGNEEADKLARQVSAKPLLGLGIPKCSAREAIKN